MINFKSLCFVFLTLCSITFSVTAQNLTARQEFFYFGSPKKISMFNSQGSKVIEFNRAGYITSIKQGSMSMIYEWNERYGEATLTMYRGDNYQEHVHVEITENSPSKLEYVVGNYLKMDVTFKENGVIDRALIVTPQFEASNIYLYNNDEEVYPYATEQSMGDKSMTIGLTINEIDDLGNVRVYTLESMGNKDVTRLIVEYY